MRRRLALIVLVLCEACVMPWQKPPPPAALKLRAPAPPEQRAGEIRIFGHELPEERAENIRERLRKTEPRILAAYEKILLQDPYAEGEVQLRVDINREGVVAEVEEIVFDVNNATLGERVKAILREVEFEPGTEAYAFYTMSFFPHPFEVLAVRQDFEGESPVLTAEILNRSAFRLSEIAVTVRVQRPDRAGPIRISRRRIRAEFEPFGRRTIRVPVTNEWAAGQYSFLLDVRPPGGDAQ